MKILIVDNGTSYLDSLKYAFKEHEVSIVAREKFKPVTAETFDVVVLSGARSVSVLNHDQEYEKELQFILHTEKPVIGICLGFELIGHAFGARLRRMDPKTKGLVDLEILKPHPIFSGVENPRVYESHRWIVEDAPRPLVELARSPDGIEILTHETKRVFGFQFHPEMFPEQTAGEKILKNCLNLF